MCKWQKVYSYERKFCKINFKKQHFIARLRGSLSGLVGKRVGLCELHIFFHLNLLGKSYIKFFLWLNIATVERPW